MASRTGSAISNGNRASHCSLQTSPIPGQTMSLAKTLQVQDQIIEQLRADQSALREALEIERANLRECRISNDKELKALQRENLQMNKTIKTQGMKIEELEKELAFAKDALATEQRNLKSLEKEHVTTVKELKLKNSKEFDKANKQEILIDQLKSEIEDLKEALESERNATNLLIREHNAEVKMLREEVRAKSTEAYRELKDRATRERDEYREMQEEAEKTYRLLEKDFREALAAKDEEIKKVKAESKAIQKELEEQLRAYIKEPIAIKNSTSGGQRDCADAERIRRLKHEVSVLKDQNRKLLNEIQLLTNEDKLTEILKKDSQLLTNPLGTHKDKSESKSKIQDGKKENESTSTQSKASRTEITRMRSTKSSQSVKKDEPIRPYVKTSTEERYEELKKTMQILRSALIFND